MKKSNSIGNGNATLRWCAVHTRYQHEVGVEKQLGLKGFETFLPMYRKIHTWTDRKKEISQALFPGYLFVADAHQDRLRVLGTAGVCAIVTVGGVAALIPDHEIATIRLAASNAAAVEPHEYLHEGDCVRVSRGPLEGLEGILIRKKGSMRLVVSVEILGRAAAVEIDGASIQRQNRSKAAASSVHGRISEPLPV